MQRLPHGIPRPPFPEASVGLCAMGRMQELPALLVTWLALLHRFLTAEVSRVTEASSAASAVRKPEKRLLETPGLLCCSDSAWTWSLRPHSPSTPALSEASLCWKVGLLMGTAL